MHIVFVTPQLATANNSSGGLASFMANMARIFLNNGHSVSMVIASTQDVNVEFDSRAKIYYFYVPMKLWKVMDLFSKMLSKVCNEDNAGIRRYFIALYKSIKIRQIINSINREHKIDIVHYSDYGALSIFANKRLPFVLRISGFSNICTKGGNTINGSLKYVDNPLALIHRKEIQTIKKSAYVISPSYLVAEIAKENLDIIPTVIESPFVLGRRDWDYSILNKLNLQKMKYIIHYGTLSYLKGIHVVAQISEEFLRKNTDYYIVLSGGNSELSEENGNKIKAEDFVKRNAGEFADRIIYVGRIVREQLYPLIQNSEMCLLPSRIENLPNTCIEAMAMGKIVVATNGASYEQLIEDRVSGFLCERDNPESFLKAINEVIGMNIKEKKEMSAKALEVTKRLEPQRIYKQYLDFYEKVIEEWDND